MKPDCLSKRLDALEREQAEPEKIVLEWADPNEDPSKDGPDVIRLKWADELEKQY
jgi:hypothetical protein